MSSKTNNTFQLLTDLCDPKVICPSSLLLGDSFQLLELVQYHSLKIFASEKASNSSLFREFFGNLIETLSSSTLSQSNCLWCEIHYPPVFYDEQCKEIARLNHIKLNEML